MLNQSNQKCIFCEIVAGREAASKIYEDDKIIAFMNIRPVNTGEFMVIPKKHIDHFLDIPDDLAKKADIKYTTLMKVESGAVNKPNVQTMAKIAKAIEDLLK